MPHFTLAVDMVAVRVGIAGEIEPLHGHSFTVVGRLQEPVHHLFVGIGGLIGQEGIDLGGCGRQAGQVESHPAHERNLVGFRRRLQALLFETGQNEIVDWIFGPALVLNLGHRWSRWRNVRPVRFPLRTLVNPAAEEVNLLGGQVPARPRRGHANGGVLRADPLVELALATLFRNDHSIAAPVGKGALLGV